MSNEINTSNAQPVSPMYLNFNHQTGQSNNLNLFYFLTNLYDNRLFILKITGFCTILATIIAFIIPSQYQVKTVLIKPNPKNYQALHTYADLTVNGNELFKLFVFKLSSPSNRLSYLQDSGLLDKIISRKAANSASTRINQLNKLAKNYKVIILNHNKDNQKDDFRDNSVEATLITISPKMNLSVQNNQAYIKYTNNQVITEIINGQREVIRGKISLLEKNINNNIKLSTLVRNNEIIRLEDQRVLDIARLNNQIDSLKKYGTHEKELQLQKLDNALQIANTLGINDFKSPKEMGNYKVNVDVNLTETELYLRGTKYLKEQIALTKANKYTFQIAKEISVLQKELYYIMHDEKALILKQRSNDKPYTKNIEQQQVELQRLKSLSFEYANVKAYQLDGLPIYNTSPIKPNKSLIIILGFLLGFMLANFKVLHNNQGAIQQSI